jgi:predicted RNA-binding Zn ribbon-like protein
MASGSSKAPPAGQWFDAADGQRWWFDSGSIAFDFAYTGGFDGPPEWETWREPGDVAAWWRDRFGVDVTVDDTAYTTSRELRRAIADAVVACAADRAIPTATVATIDLFAAGPDLAPQLGDPIPATADRLLATIARDAVASLAQPERVRTCTAGDCGLMYLDTSRSQNRAWCSMKRCGNRHKVRQHRARRAADRPEPPLDPNRRPIEPPAGDTSP